MFHHYTHFLLSPIKAWTFAIICLLGLSGLGASTAHSAPSAAEYGVVLNLSGKQRMLSQKMSKEVVLISLNFDKGDNLVNLEESSSLFAQTLRGLKDGDASLGLPPTTNGDILAQLDVVAGIWTPFYAAIEAILDEGEVSEASLQTIAEMNLPLLKEMNKAVGMYEKDAQANGLKASAGLATTLNLSGKQRMLSQKMTKEFFLIVSEFETGTNQEQLGKTYALFDRTLEGLLDGDEGLSLPGTQSAGIRDQLGIVDELWQEFMPFMKRASEGGSAQISQEDLQMIASINLPLLKEMNKAVKMYESEAAK